MSSVGIVKPQVSAVLLEDCSSKVDQTHGFTGEKTETKAKPNKPTKRPDQTKPKQPKAICPNPSASLNRREKFHHDTGDWFNLEQ